jgi:hypothetical protein
MTTNNNPRSNKQAYAWMNETQRRMAYLAYKQEVVRSLQNTITQAIEEDALRSTLGTLYDKLEKAEATVVRLERQEYARYLKAQERAEKALARQIAKGEKLEREQIS